MNLKSKFKRILSGVLSLAVTASILPCFPAFADEQAEPDRYPYTMFAASDYEGAITVNANNFCVNGNVATNGTIVSSGNMNVNGTRTENANEEMIYILKKLNHSYFSGDNVEVYVEDYSFEDLNININNPMDVYGSLELTGNINLNSGIKAYEDVIINGEVKNTNEAVICSETGDIVIETTNVNFNGLIYAPYGDIIIETDNLNLNNVVIIGQTITLDCPNVNANYSRNTAELVGAESDIDVELFAMGKYNSEANIIDIEWYTNYPNSSYEIWISDDNADYTSVDVVSDGTTYQYQIAEDFERRYFKISLTTNYGEYIESIPFVVTKTESDYSVDFLDSDDDGLPDVFEIMIGSDVNNSDTDDDGLTDYQEVCITGTDPAKYDSVTEGVSDSDADSDGDGLSNAQEIELGTDPQLYDTDDDSLSDYDELYVYGTDPLKPDTDDDGLNDDSELKLGFDPNDPETYGIPDSEYSIEQSISSDNKILSSINTEDSPFELSIDIKTNGDAEKEISISQSAYSNVIENDAMIGASLDFFISNTCNPEEIVVKYSIKDAYIDNTLNIYSSLEEFQGIKRLNIFKFYEDKNMLLPIETEFDVENGLLYAEVDELGTYCIMDMEIWLNNLGVEMQEESQQEENAMYFSLPSIQSASENSGSGWTPTYTNAPIDLVFILQTSGKHQDEFEKEKTLIKNFCLYVFNNYKDVNVTIITFDKSNANILMSSTNNIYLKSFIEVNNALNRISYKYENGYCDRGQAFKRLLGDMTLRENADVFIYLIENSKTDAYNNFDQIVLMNREIGSYSEIFPKGWKYEDYNYGLKVKNRIDKNGDLFITIDDNTISTVIEHLEGKLSPLQPVYDIITPTNWKTISLKGELSPSNGIDTDGDSLTDWKEVDTDRLIWNADGSFDLPTIEIEAIVSHRRFQNCQYLFNDLKNGKPYYLPILSDPTMKDSDGDGIEDGIDKEPLKPAHNELIDDMDKAELRIKLIAQREADIKLTTELKNLYSPDKCVDMIFENDRIITDTANKYNMPKSYIQSVVFRELYCYGLDDPAADYAFENYYLSKEQEEWYLNQSLIYQILVSYPSPLIPERDITSTGLGQIQLTTAISANNWGCEKGYKDSYLDDTWQTRRDMYLKLQDNEFNIDMVAIVLMWGLTTGDECAIENPTDKYWSFDEQEILAMFARYNTDSGIINDYGHAVYNLYLIFEEYK